MGKGREGNIAGVLHADPQTAAVRAQPDSEISDVTVLCVKVSVSV